MRTALRSTAGVLLMAGVAACGADNGATTTGPRADIETDRTTAPGQLFLYNGGGLHRTAPAMPCIGPGPYRDFDFWVGEWEVFGATSGTLAGTNRIVSLLDGCLVEENWTGATGGRGRSMNAYDAATGTWSQYWMDQFGLHLRLEGGLQNGDMVMQGPRIAFLVGGGTIEVIDRITWTPLAGGDVNQFWDVSLDQGATFPIVFFNGNYVSTPGVQPAPPLQTSFCTSPSYRELDFLVGDWNVAGVGGADLGTASIAIDMEGCMLEEDFSTGTGYESQSFFGWDSTRGQWYRNYLDTEGVRLLLSGGMVNGSMLLEGERPRAGNKSLHIRVTITPNGSDTVTQSWETSLDGVTWKDGASVVFTRM